MLCLWFCRARSGIIFLGPEATETQKAYFGSEDLDNLRGAALKKWKGADVTNGRKKVRTWLDVKYLF